MKVYQREPSNEGYELMLELDKHLIHAINTNLQGVEHILPSGLDWPIIESILSDAYELTK